MFKIKKKLKKAIFPLTKGFKMSFNFITIRNTINNNLLTTGVAMNKAQLIEKVATETTMTKADIERLLDCTIDTIKKTIKKGEDVKLVGFGTFTKAKRKARTGRNPQTGKAIKIPAAWYPKFRPGSEFKNLVR